MEEEFQCANPSAEKEKPVGTHEPEAELIFCLSKVAEYRSFETGSHIKRVAYYSRQIARSLGLPEKEQDLIFKAAPMHDIGKVGVPDHILRKHGNLNKEEYHIMKQHTHIGYRLLQEGRSRLLQTAAEIALTHHERFNGTGYPEGLNHAKIPLHGRIVALADVFDSLTTEKPYKKALEAEEALQYIKEKSGQHFDPDCVEAFVKDWREILEIKNCYRDEEEKA